MKIVKEGDINVVLDLDEVLCEQVRHVHKAARERNLGEAWKLTPKSYQSLHYHKWWNVEPLVAHEFLLDYLGHHSLELLPVEGAQESLSRIKEFGRQRGRRVNYHVLTSRSVLLEQATMDQLDYRFPGMFETVTLTGHAEPKPPTRSKLYWYRQLEGDAFVDDMFDNVQQCIEGFGGLGVVFGHYSWNRPSTSEILTSGIYRRTSWRETEELMLNTLF